MTIGEPDVVAGMGMTRILIVGSRERAGSGIAGIENASGGIRIGDADDPVRLAGIALGVAGRLERLPVAVAIVAAQQCSTVRDNERLGGRVNARQLRIGIKERLISPIAEDGLLYRGIKTYRRFYLAVVCEPITITLPDVVVGVIRAVIHGGALNIGVDRVDP